MQIKKNIWKHKTTNGTLFIKKYENSTLAEKVKFIHHQLERVQFPYVIPLKKSKEPNLLVQSWQHNSSSADFSNPFHRENSLKILRSLHQTSDEIDWRSSVLIPRQYLFQKWNARLERFLINEKELVPYLKHAYYDIAYFASRIIKKIRHKNDKINRKLTLLHGDVVHHNFLICEDGSMKIIDFDLAVVGDAAEEMILWMHRALPTIGYDLESLLNESPYLYDLCLEKLHYLQYPNELLREWLFVLQLSQFEKRAFLDYLMPFTERALSHWPDLIEQIEKFQAE